MLQPAASRQFGQSGPAGFLSSGISSAEQHIVQGPQDFPGAAVNGESFWSSADSNDKYSRTTLSRSRKARAVLTRKQIVTSP